MQQTEEGGDRISYISPLDSINLLIIKQLAINVLVFKSNTWHDCNCDLKMQRRNARFPNQLKKNLPIGFHIHLIVCMYSGHFYSFKLERKIILFSIENVHTI